MTNITPETSLLNVQNKARELEAARRATSRIEQQFAEAIIAANAWHGARKIAPFAMLSHQRVSQILLAGKSASAAAA